MKIEHLPAESSSSDIHNILARDGCVVIDKLLSESLVDTNLAAARFACRYTSSTSPS